jgi:hypothetical protein
MESLLNLIRKEAPDYWNAVEVVGKWVWIQFEAKQPHEITAALSQLSSQRNIVAVQQGRCVREIKQTVSASELGTNLNKILHTLRASGASQNAEPIQTIR